MGIHSSRTGELFFDNVRLGRDRLLGETEDNASGDGRDSARSNFSAERIGVAAMALGVIEECLRLCGRLRQEQNVVGPAKSVSSS